MSAGHVTVYISDNNASCSELLTQLDDWNVPYTIKNVSRNHYYMKELQETGIYGTPATFLNGNDPILGFQKRKLQHALRIWNT